MKDKYTNFRGAQLVEVLRIEVNEGEGVEGDPLYKEVYYVTNKKNNMKTIEVNGEKYVSEADYKAKKVTTVPSKKQIVILQRGWVVIGDYSVNKDGECVLTDAGVIRVWGTTKGLGEIASDGPNSLTKIDRTPDMRFHPMTVIARMDVTEEKWNKAY